MSILFYSFVVLFFYLFLCSVGRKQAAKGSLPTRPLNISYGFIELFLYLCPCSVRRNQAKIWVPSCQLYGFVVLFLYLFLCSVTNKTGKELQRVPTRYMAPSCLYLFLCSVRRKQGKSCKEFPASSINFGGTVSLFVSFFCMKKADKGSPASS
jgi:hypothetical protein